MAALYDGRDRSWMDFAACRNHPNPDIWYPDSSNLFTAETREAKRICSSCPVSSECYDYGRTERFGIYGGVNMATGRLLPSADDPGFSRMPARPRPARVRVQPKPAAPRRSEPVKVQARPAPVHADPVEQRVVEEPVVVDRPTVMVPDDRGSDDRQQIYAFVPVAVKKAFRWIFR